MHDMAVSTNLTNDHNKPAHQRRWLQMMAAAIAVVMAVSVIPAILPDRAIEAADSIPVASHVVPAEADAAVPAVAWAIASLALRFGVPFAIRYGQRLNVSVQAWAGAAQYLRNRGWRCPRTVTSAWGLAQCRR